MDRHYTPYELATRIVGSLTCIPPKSAADFAAGSGVLLRAISERWPKCRLYATDIDSLAVHRLRNRFANLSAGVCDFLNVEEHGRSRTLRRAVGNISLAFINPPFSCRGGTIYEVTYRGRVLTCSKAMAFVVGTMKFLKSNGQLIALLPSSCLTSEKDAIALKTLSIDFDIEELGRAAPYEFEDCAVEVSFVKLSRRDYPLAQPDHVDLPAPPQLVPAARATLFRGKLQMPKVRLASDDLGIPLIHSTELRGGRVAKAAFDVDRCSSTIHGPAVLLPRVGKPNVKKICLYESGDEIALSDCVISVRGDSLRSTKFLFRLLASHWSALQEQYIGSCAKYMTLCRLAQFLENRGVSVQVVGKSNATTKRDQKARAVA